MQDGFVDITSQQVANAVNRCAHWLKEKLGTRQSRVFCYFGPLDLRYIILTLAAPKAGHTVCNILQHHTLANSLSQAFFTSHRNSVEAHISLVKKTECSAFLFPSDDVRLARHILDSCPMQEVTTPDLEYFLDREPVEPVPFLKSFDQVRNDPFCILHTSGSTGIPKPVPVTYGSYGGMDSQLLIPSLGHKPTFLSHVRGKRMLLALPVFHAASLNWTTGIGLFAGVTCVLPPPMPLTADLASQIFEHSLSYGAIMAPSLLVDCYHNDIYRMRMLQGLELIVYGGGMLPEKIGDTICQKIRLMTLMGSCETSLLPHQMLDDPKDWEYISLSPCLGHTFKDDRDGLGNLTIVRQPKYEMHQGVFSAFPEKEEHASGDLFEPHPHKAGLWRFRARADDIISFTTAEKLNPTTMESTIQANPLVKSAVVGGQGQFQASLLLEPRHYPRNAEERQDFLDKVWPSILQANCDCPAHGRIMKGFVMLTDPEKPLPRASKDTVQRHAVFKLYEAEWNSLYHRLARPDHIPREEVVQPPETPDVGTTRGIVLSDAAILAIERIVERKVATALHQLASAFMTGAAQLQSLDFATSPSIVAQEGDVSSMGNILGTGVDKNMKHTLNSTSAGATQPKDFVKQQLRQIIHNTLAENLNVDDLQDDSNLFKSGLDSLQVPPLVKAINRFITESKQPVNHLKIEAIYSNPTVARIVAHVIA